MSDDDEAKPAKKRPKGNYAIGYAKTPEHTRFKPGNEIGKRGGRPKGRKNNATLIREILEHKIEIKLPGGASKRVSLLHAATWKLAMKALSGDPRAYAEIAQLAVQVGIVTSEPPPADEELSPDQAETFARFRAALEAEVMARHAAGPSGPSAPEAHAIVVSVPGRPTVRRVTFGVTKPAAGSVGGVV